MNSILKCNYSGLLDLVIILEKHLKMDNSLKFTQSFLYTYLY